MNSSRKDKTALALTAIGILSMLAIYFSPSIKATIATLLIVIFVALIFSTSKELLKD